MRVVFVLITFLMGCSSTKPISMKPLDAEIPELRFSYSKNGSFIVAHGHAADHFAIGDSKVLKIRVHSRGGKCVLRYIDGDFDLSKDCTGLSEVTLDLGKHYEGQPEVIGISVSQEKLGVQQGFFYPSLRQARAELPLEFKCPFTESRQDLAVCTRPASYSFKLKVKIANNLPGEVLEKLVCNDGTQFENLKPVSGSSDYSIEFTPKSPTFCVLGVGLKQGKKADGSYTIIQSKSVFVRFYNPKYIPLPTPSVVIEDGKKKVCGSERYDAFAIGEKDFKGYLDSGKCVLVPDNFEFMAWDSIGRFIWKTGDPLFNALSVKREGWNFYENAKPWVVSNMKPCSSSKCVRSELDRLSKHPKMIKAVEAWDSSLLYKE